MLISKIFNPKILFIIIFFVCSYFGFLYVKNSWDTSLKDTSEQAFLIAKTSAYTLNGVMLDQLEAVPEDEGTEAYESIKERIQMLLTLDKNIRFVYLYTKKDNGKLYLMADSEPTTSPDYSPPGQEYTEASEEYYQAFNTGKEILTPPNTDRWGTWITTLVPIQDFETKQVKAVLGIDYPASVWNESAMSHAIQSGVIVFLILLVVVVFFVVANDAVNLRISNKRFEDIVESSTDWIWEIDKDKKYTFVSGKVRKILGYNPEEILGKTPFDFMAKEDLKKNMEFFSKIFDERKEFHDWENWRVNKDGKKVFIKTNAVPRFDRRGEFIGYRGLNEDNTLRKKAEDALKDKVEQLEKINKLMVGRELKMIELKAKMKKTKGKKEK